MNFNSSQRWRLEKLISEIITETENGFAVNREQVINEIEMIVENKTELPKCKMLGRCNHDMDACNGVLDGSKECGDCYGDVVESLKPLEKVAKGNPGKQSFPTVSSKGVDSK